MSEKYYIVDIDGTLYFHTPVRFMMIIEMLIHLFRHPLSYKEIILIHKYRQYHKSDLTIDHHLFAKTNKLNINYTNKIIYKWMIQKPLKWIKIFADKKLISISQTLICYNISKIKKLGFSSKLFFWSFSKWLIIQKFRNSVFLLLLTNRNN